MGPFAVIFSAWTRRTANTTTTTFVIFRNIWLFLLLFACSDPAPVQENPSYELRNDLQYRYAELQLTGSFILHDQGRDHWTFVDSTQADIGMLPASSFKIFSSLFALGSVW